MAKPHPSPSSSSSAAPATTTTTPDSAPPPPPAALPTAEALEVLLSPDGYYRYLGIPRPEPDVAGLRYREATAASGGANNNNNNNNNNDGGGGGIDLDRVKRNYRRLSLRHHPDRKTGDAETFRVLNRAKVVLGNPKLRREYDLVGLDLEDDDDQADDHHHHHGGDNAGGGGGAAAASDDHDDVGGGGGGRSNEASGGGNDSSEKDGGEARHHHRRADDGGSGSGSGSGSSKTETVMGHLASATLAAVLQVVVRTGLMGTVSVLISRYTILTLPAMGVLAYISYKLYSALRATLGKNILSLHVMKDALSPLVIAFGIFCMYRGRRFVIVTSSSSSSGVDNAIVGDGAIAGGATTTTTTTIATCLDWSWTFWFGEALVMTLFVSNSFEKQPRALVVAFAVLSLLSSLWLRGRFWRYATVLVLEGVIAMLCVVIFPVMEMILESIVEDKMRKVGEKIRAHDKRMRELLSKKKKEHCGSTSF
ncbi:hypothetical protein ACHAW5_010994 [Stephanodiscus triporus]|uniref:J domain-containing protein n=1 Tax=Stephanodiscus triporus TaxID=2934178 RepID=A0ABD3NBE5_9STRA